MAFGGFLKQSTAVDVLIGPFVDETDGKTAENGLTISASDVLLSKNGQTLTLKSDVTAAANDSIGYYNCELDATDTDTLGQLATAVHVSGALPVRLDFQVVSAENYESRYESTSIFDVLLRGNEHNTRHSFGWRIRRASGGTDVVIDTGTAQGSGTGNNQIQLQAGSETTDDIYNGTVISIIEGTGLGQTRTIFDYDGGTITVTVSKDWVTNPSSDSVYNINAASTSNASQSGIAQSGGATNIRLASDASDQDDFYNGSLVNIVSGTGSGQTRTISDYAGATTDATVSSAWSVNPDSTSLYEVIPAAEAAEDQNTSVAPTVEEIWSKAVSDLAAGAPSSTASVITAINYLYEAWRNKTVTDKTGSEIIIYKNNGSTKLMESDITDDGTLFTKGAFGAVD